MLKAYNKLRVPDENKSQDVLLEVNWNASDKSSNECKLIRITMGDKTALVKKEHFYSLLFAMGTEEQQRKIVPEVKKTTRWYETVITVKAKKDIKAGEDLTFPLKLTLPTVEEEVIGQMKEELAKDGQIIIKKK